MKILILGGTGAMGNYLSSLLVEKGHAVYVTSRKNRIDSDIHYIQGDAHDFTFISSILKQYWDIIIDFMVYNLSEFDARINGFLTMSGRYIFLSTSRVYADNEQLIREDSPRLLDVCKDEVYLATEEYALAKAREENLLFNNKLRNWTIIRPYITYAVQRLQLGVYEKENWLYRVLHGRTVVFPNDIAEHTTTLTYGYDVASVIAELATKAEAEGEVFHITCDKAILWSDVLRIYQKTVSNIVGKPFNVKIIDNAKSIYSIMKNEYQVRYDRLFNRRFDNTKVKNVLGYDLNFLNPDEGLRKCLTKFLSNIYRFDYMGGRLEAYQDTVTKERTPLNEFSSIRQKVGYILRRYLGYKR